jgi:hypothetical protein
VLRRGPIPPLCYIGKQLFAGKANKAREGFVRVEDPPKLPEAYSNDVGINQSPDAAFPLAQVGVQVRVLQGDGSLR